MFSKVAILATLSLALSVAAAPHGDAEYKCNTGEIQCCNSVHKSGSARATELAGIVGLAAQDTGLLSGESCSPISIAAIAGGASCNQQPMCCENNQMNGLVVIGCTPITISL